MFYRGQLCELYFQILDRKQCRRPHPKKFPIRFTPLPKVTPPLYPLKILDPSLTVSTSMGPSLVVVKVDVSVRRVEGVRQHFSGSVERVAVDVVVAAIESDIEVRIVGRRQHDMKTWLVGPVLRRYTDKLSK